MYVSCKISRIVYLALYSHSLLLFGIVLCMLYNPLYVSHVFITLFVFNVHDVAAIMFCVLYV